MFDDECFHGPGLGDDKQDHLASCSHRGHGPLSQHSNLAPAIAAIAVSYHAVGASQHYRTPCDTDARALQQPRLRRPIRIRDDQCGRRAQMSFMSFAQIL